MLPCSPKLEVREAIYHMCKNALASNKLFEAYAHRIISAKNGVAALRQEAFRADRHFSNASNKLFEAIIPQKRPAYNAALWEEKKGAIHYEDTQKKRLRATIYGSQTLFRGIVLVCMDRSNSGFQRHGGAVLPLFIDACPIAGLARPKPRPLCALTS